MKILNLYAGIGGNRKLWGNEHEVTAVELDKELAAIYQDYFPQDKVVVADAHKFLLEHFQEFDFIWASPPCPTHSRVRKALAVKKRKDGSSFVQNKPKFPDMTLYAEIIFLDNYFDGSWVVENVVPFYEPLIEAQKAGRHLFWANFKITEFQTSSSVHMGTIKEMGIAKGFDLTKYSIKHRKDTVLRNCVFPELGLHVFECAFKEVQVTLN
ncbi:DNA cytosine methyltransferase [Candidatus Woesearchaeota archaeon]|nr:DNA cytosine methyltransferase [Candidatus Woesearchaeota archaeon]